MAESVRTLAARQLTIDDFGSSRIQVKELRHKLNSLRKQTYAGIVVLVVAVVFLAYHTETRLSRELEAQRFRHQLARKSEGGDGTQDLDTLVRLKSEIFYIKRDVANVKQDVEAFRAKLLEVSKETTRTTPPKATTTITEETVKQSEFELLQKRVEESQSSLEETRKKTELCEEKLSHRVSDQQFQLVKGILVRKIDKIMTEMKEIRNHVNQSDHGNREKFNYWSELTLEINGAVKDLEEMAAEASKNSTERERRLRQTFLPTYDIHRM